ncbi:MAG: hypothetical protein RIT45_3957 [Pseudomonadota bacterium]
MTRSAHRFSSRSLAVAAAGWLLSLLAVAPAALAKTTVCPGPVTLHGLDVSYWQLDINWDKVKATGQQYVIMRAAHALKADTKFAYNWKRCHEVGLRCGVYQYFEPDVDPVAQANLMLQMMGTLKPGDLPPVIDVESKGSATPAQLAAAVGKWIAHVQAKTGRVPMIYTGAYFWEDYVKSSAFVNNPLWHAQYCTNCCPKIADPWKKWFFWQYSSTGKVDGINGNVDTNRWNGDQKALDAFAAIKTCTPGCNGNKITDASCNVGDCGAYGAYCSTVVSPSPKCVSAFCTSAANVEPTAGDVCLPDGKRYTCDSKGDIKLKACPADTICKGTLGKATCEPTTCAPGCKGTAIVAKDCSQTDCAKLSGANAGTCVNDADGLRCVSKHCPPSGVQAICVADLGPLAMGLCNKGKITISNCLAGSQVCATAEGGIAACADPACAPAAGKTLQAHADCVDAATVAHCDAYGQRTLETCPSGTICSGDPGEVACAVVDVPDAGGGTDAGGTDAGGADAASADAGGASADAATGDDGGAPVDGDAGPSEDGSTLPVDTQGGETVAGADTGSGAEDGSDGGLDGTGVGGDDGLGTGSAGNNLASAAPSGCSAGTSAPAGTGGWPFALVLALAALLRRRAMRGAAG